MTERISAKSNFEKLPPVAAGMPLAVVRALVKHGYNMDSITEEIKISSGEVEDCFEQIKGGFGRDGRDGLVLAVKAAVLNGQIDVLGLRVFRDEKIRRYLLYHILPDERVMPVWSLAIEGYSASKIGGDLGFSKTQVTNILQGRVYKRLRLNRYSAVAVGWTIRKLTGSVLPEMDQVWLGKNMAGQAAGRQRGSV